MKKIIISLILTSTILGVVGITGLIYSQNKKAEVLNEVNGTSSENKNISEETKTTVENANNEKANENNRQAIAQENVEKVVNEKENVVSDTPNENTSVSNETGATNNEVKDEVIALECNNPVNPPVVETPEVTPPVQEPTNSSSFMAQVESLIFTKVNEERVKAGVAALSHNDTMEYYARIKSQDMGDRGYFDHTNPDGELITAQMRRDGVSYNSWGENIAYIGGTTDANALATDANALADQFMTNWMNSSGHRANILSTNFSSIGVGVYKVGNRSYATQEFYR